MNQFTEWKLYELVHKKALMQRNRATVGDKTPPVAGFGYREPWA